MAITVKQSADISASITPNRKLGYIFAAAATLSWSCTGIFIDALTSHYSITPLDLSFWRTLLIVVGVGLFLMLRDISKGTNHFRFSHHQIGFYLIYGLVGVGVFNLLWSNSVAINKAAVATALLYCAPVFVTIGAWFLFGERLRLAGAIAIGIDLVGVFLVAGAYDIGALWRNGDGLLLAVGSGLTFAIYTLWGKMVRSNPISGMFFAFVFALVGLFAWGLTQEGWGLFEVQLDGWGWVLLIVLAFGPTLGGFTFFSLAIQHLEAGVASLFTTLEPPITALLAWLFLNHSLTPIQWLGASLIVGGVITLQTAGGKKLGKSVDES